MRKAAFALLFVLLLAPLAGVGEIAEGKTKFKAPVTDSGLPEATINSADLPGVKNWLINHLANSNFFLVKQDENLLTFETMQKPMTFSQELGYSVMETGMTKAMSNHKYLLRVTCQLLQLRPEQQRVIIRAFSIGSPGTPAERVNEITQQALSQETYFKLLDQMKTDIEAKTAETPQVPMLTTPQPEVKQ